MKTMRKTKTSSAKEPSEVRLEEPQPIIDYRNGQYKVYVRHDETNGELIESLVSINWPEFLNKEIPEGSSEEDLAHLLVPDEYYVVGKRLVKFLYEIPTTRIIVCDLARLTPKPEEQYDQWRRRHANDHIVNLDVEEEKKKEQEQQKQEQPKIKNVDKPIYL